MRRLFGIGVLGCSTLLTCVTQAAAYDDPAVAVCQFTKFHGEDLSAAGYTRVNTRIEGNKVFIDFERSVLNTPPSPEYLECWFYEQDGYFHIMDTVKARKRRCSQLERLAEIKDATQFAKDEWEMNQSTCLVLYADPEPPWDEFDRKTIEPLNKLGIYPIPASNTALRPS